MAIMDKLVRLAFSAPRPSGGVSKEDRKEYQQEEDRTYLDPRLLSYIDKLSSQEDFVVKVGWLRAPGSTGFYRAAPQAPDWGSTQVLSLIHISEPTRLS